MGNHHVPAGLPRSHRSVPVLNALSICLAEGDPDGVARASRALERQGFQRAARIQWEGGDVIAWAHPGQRKSEDCIVQTPRGRACCVGPLWYRGYFGRPALVAVLEDVHATGKLQESALRGNFALFLETSDQTWLLNDALGLVRVYGSDDGCFFSTSWLSTGCYLKQVELDPVAATEYVLAGASHSCRSVARGVHVLPLGQVRDLRGRRAWQRFPDGFSSRAPEFVAPEEAVDAIAGHLRKVWSEVASAFTGRVNTALSGGFDSRLIVAGLLAAGVQPRLFVYGDQDSLDVVIARKVANAIDLAIDAIDKSELNRGLPEPDLESLQRNALFFDGLPNDGILDPGADMQTRLQQNADGTIALNGGGGEIFRNFFHLPNGRFTARDIVRSFYRGINRGVFRKRDGLSKYEAQLAASIRDIPGLSNAGNARFSRPQVELLYPLFRCHYWMSVNNSVSVRHGHYATPLLDRESVRLALRVPLRWKNAGAFQSRLIAALHSGIAAQPSAYGFRFDQGPDWKARVTEWSNCARPVRMRPLINATRRHLGNERVDPELLQHYRALLPGEWQVDPWLDLTQLAHGGALERALSIEVVFRHVF